MTNLKDDWEKPRARNQHLTDTEIADIRAAYKAKRPLRDIARELKCSSRTVSKYYGYFRAEGVPQNEPSPAPVKSSRFYSSTFEPA